MEVTKSDNINYISSKIRNIPDFPRPGIQFKDITPLLQDPKALKLTSELLLQPYQETEADYVIGIESRGFIFGSRMAQDLNAGFIPVRKPGKLPAETISAEYELEYGSDRVEMHKDALKPNDKVIIHDDLIATGGSAAAVTKMIHQTEAEIAGYSFIIELAGLNGMKKLDDKAAKEVLITV